MTYICVPIHKEGALHVFARARRHTGAAPTVFVLSIKLHIAYSKYLIDEENGLWYIVPGQCRRCPFRETRKQLKQLWKDATLEQLKNLMKDIRKRANDTGAYVHTYIHHTSNMHTKFCKKHLKKERKDQAANTQTTFTTRKRISKIIVCNV